MIFVIFFVKLTQSSSWMNLTESTEEPGFKIQTYQPAGGGVNNRCHWYVGEKLMDSI